MAPTVQAAPWAAHFKQNVDKMSSPEFVLSTLDYSSGQAMPRARYCIYRGMWADLPPNKHNEAERNPKAWISDCPTFSTDARMQKGWQLVASADPQRQGRGGGAEDGGSGTEDRKALESGGGGPVEAVWWIKEDNIMEQWRVKGSAWVLGQNIDSDQQEAKMAREALQARMREGDEKDQASKWSWDREITAHFGNVSPGMRGTWKNPPPGVSTSVAAEGDHKLGEKVQDLHDQTARSNFRVVVIVPDEVERVELADPEKARRVVYGFDREKGTWWEEERWP